MSLALIQESAKEVRRLAIAGSSLAVGDFRLKKLVAPLEQAGAKVPVFAQVAKAVGDLVDGPEADSAANLLNLSTLLNAILYTQGQFSADGGYRELEMIASNGSSTRTPARMLKPLIHALTTNGSGRFEIVQAACDRGTFNDLRLIDPAIQALGDNYPELADLVAGTILPGYGPGIVPRLKAGFDLKGKKPDARRLQLMHQLDAAATLDLCKTALDDGSPEVKAAAIICLGKHADCLPLVLEQARAKNKLLRSAALEALAEHDQSEITKLFTDLIKGKTLDLLAGPFRVLRNRQVLTAFLAEGKRVFASLIKGDAEQIGRCSEILDCLAQRKDAEVEEFLLACFSQGEKLAKLKAPKNSQVAGADLLLRLAELLYLFGSPPTLNAILAKRAVLPAAAFRYVLAGALRVWPPEQVFQEFSPLLRQTKGPAKERFELVERVISATSWADSVHFNPLSCDDDWGTPEQPALMRTNWDPRWLDAAIKTNRPTIVCSLARPNHQAALNYLLKLGETKKLSDPGLLIRALARCQYPKVTDFYLHLIAKQAKGAKFLDFELQLLFVSARYLPAADLPTLDAFAATLDEKFMDAFLEALAPLRTTKPTI
jgi:hypothetical protein